MAKTGKAADETIGAILALAPVVAVVTVRDERDAVPLAQALARGGVRAVEVTLRTEAALASVKAIVHGVPEIVVGIGTALTAKDLAAGQAAGARFAASPGLDPELIAAAKAAHLPYLPGVATPSEVMQARRLGAIWLKFFPAEALGGARMLRQLAGPFADARFCPTGGVVEETLAKYLALPNVAAVGGSWLAPEQDVAMRAWENVARRAKRAMEIAASRPAA